MFVGTIIIQHHTYYLLQSHYKSKVSLSIMSMEYFPCKKPFSSNLACICGLDKCKSITKQFRSIQDARGQLQALPNSVANSRKGKVHELNAFYSKRVRIHRPLATPSLNEQIKKKAGKLTRNSQDERKEVYVATRYIEHGILIKRYFLLFQMVSQQFPRKCA